MSAAQKSKRKKARVERQRKYKWIFVNGKQVRIKQPDTTEGMDPEDYIRLNADEIWLTQNERYDILFEREMQGKESAGNFSVDEPED